MPNYLNAPVLYGSRAYVPSKQDNIEGGAYRGNPGMTFDQTVRAVTSIVDLPSGVEQTGLRIDHDNAGVATGAALSGEGRYLFVALETSREVAVYDTLQGFQLTRLVGRPRAAGRRVLEQRPHALRAQLHGPQRLALRRDESRRAARGAGAAARHHVDRGRASRCPRTCSWASSCSTTRRTTGSRATTT